MDDEGYRGDIVGCVLLSFKLRAFSLCTFTVSALCTKTRLFNLRRNKRHFLSALLSFVVTIVTVIALEQSFHLSLSVCQFGGLQPRSKGRGRFLWSSVLCNPAPVVLRNPTVSLGVARNYLPLNARNPIWHTDKSRFSFSISRYISLTRHDIEACQ